MSVLKFFGGIDGGGTKTSAVLLDSAGTVVGRASVDESTNHWLVGFESCAKTVSKLIRACRADAKHALDAPPLACVGISLSGMGFVEEEKTLISVLEEIDPTLSLSYNVCEDTDGALATAVSDGGIILIAGTGSNCVLWKPGAGSGKDTRIRVGGWGHFLGDKGSAYYIASRAIQAMFRMVDGELLEGEEKSDCEFVQKEVFDYFGIQTRRDLLPFFYTKFEKSFVARFCVRVASGALSGDKLCKKVMEKAGYKLGRAVASALRQFHEVQAESESKSVMHIVCVGGVFKSAKLIIPGVLKALEDGNVTTPVKFVRVAETCAIGAAYLAAKSVDCDVKIDYSKTSQDISIS